MADAGRPSGGNEDVPSVGHRIVPGAVRPGAYDATPPPGTPRPGKPAREKDEDEP